MLRILTRGLQYISKSSLTNVVHDASNAAALTLQHHKLELVKTLTVAPVRTFSLCWKFPSHNQCVAAASQIVNGTSSCNSNRNLLEQRLTLPLVAWGQPVRNNIKFSNRKGKRKTVRAVINRFYRLQWGGWIRPRLGRHKRLWSKKWRRRQKDRRHILCNAHYSKLFDHMTAKFWRKPKYYIDDPYEPYNVRLGIRKTTNMYKNKPLFD